MQVVQKNVTPSACAFLSLLLLPLLPLLPLLLLLLLLLPLLLLLLLLLLLVATEAAAEALLLLLLLLLLPCRVLWRLPSLREQRQRAVNLHPFNQGPSLFKLLPMCTRSKT